jgi:DNA-binding CsgD family transcriptional regulator
MRLVGRDSELASAELLVYEHREGPVGLVLEGEAGIGKTALWRTILERASARGYRTLSCQAAQAETRLAFAGLSDLIDESANPAIAGLAGPQREALEVALLRRAPVNGKAPDRRTLGLAVRAVLRDLAREAPLVVAVDDLQWLDTSTMRLLSFAARRLDDHPVTMVLTVRGPPFGADPLGLDRAFGADAFLRLHLEGLAVDEIGDLLELHLGQRRSRRLVGRVAQASAGNPLFALECARAFDSDASSGASRFPVPASLRELMLKRLATVAPPARQALLAAASLARPTSAVVAQASSADGLTNAEESGLLRVDGDRVLFAHPLYAAAVYDAVATGRRRSMHQLLAQLIDDPDESVEHLALAAAKPDEDIAWALVQAADRARLRGASAAAARLLEHSIELTPSSLSQQRLERMMAAAEDHLFAGDRDRPAVLLEQVAAGLPAGPKRARALCALAHVRLWHDSYDEARQLLEQAVEEGAGDDWVRARSHLDLVWVLSQAGGPLEVAAHLAAAAELADRVDDTQLLAELLAGVATTERMQGLGRAEEGMERALALERWDTRTYMGVRPSFNAAWLWLWLGHIERAQACSDTLQEHLVANGQESALPMAALQAVSIACAAGRLADAARLGEQAVATSLESDSRIVHGVALLARATALAQLGQLAAAEADARESLVLLDAAGGAVISTWATGVLGFVALSLGDAARADELLAPLAALVLQHGLGEPMMAPFLPDEIEALIRLGELERASQLLDLLEQKGGQLSSRWALGAAQRSRALLHAAHGDLDAAAAALDQARVHNEHLGMPLERARTLLVQGQLHRRQRQKRAARESLTAALSIFDQCGASSWGKHAHDELARVGTRRTSQQLTATEQRVATLAANGMTNREIAATLFISPKTVEANIAKTYRKLSIRSRAELGMAIARRSGPPDLD